MIFSAEAKSKTKLQLLVVMRVRMLYAAPSRA
jgi:hypothetical protein